MVAVEIEVDDPESDLDSVRLRGPVDTLPTDTDFLQLLGVDVDSTSAIRFEDNAGNPISRSTFFNALQTGTLVDVDGRLSADSRIDASELELED